MPIELSQPYPTPLIPSFFCLLQRLFTPSTQSKYPTFKILHHPHLLLTNPTPNHRSFGHRLSPFRQLFLCNTCHLFQYFILRPSPQTHPANCQRLFILSIVQIKCAQQTNRVKMSQISVQHRQTVPDRLFIIPGSPRLRLF